MAKIHRIGDGAQVERGISRSGAGSLLSGVSERLPKIISDTTGDMGIKYDNLSAPKKVGTLVIAGALALGGAGLAFNAVANGFNHEANALVKYQDSIAVGKHPLISFEIEPGGTANVRSHAAKGGEDILMVMTEGQSVVCAPEVRTEDGHGNLTEWAMVRNSDGTYGFVNTDENRGVRVVENPSGCPDEGVISLNEMGNFGERYSLDTLKGPLPENFAVIQPK